MSIFTPVDGAVSFNRKELATALGFTEKGFRERVFNLGFKQVWMEAKRLASARAGASESQLDEQVTDEDFLKAARSLL
jgi:hypothetical protein